MNLDALQKALADPDTASLFKRRSDAAEAIEGHKLQLSVAQATLADIEAQIATRLGIEVESPKRQMTCSKCGQKGHNAKGCPDAR